MHIIEYPNYNKFNQAIFKQLFIQALAKTDKQSSKIFEFSTETTVKN